jgi:SAM-dependent methyltransferase
MFNFLDAPRSDPTSIYRYRDGLYAADLLTAALAHLDFFTWLDEHPSDLKSICIALDLKERPADVMLTLFSAMGLLEARADVFHLTLLAREHLIKSSVWNIEPFFASLKERPVCKDMLNVLRTGKPANWGSLKNEQEWAKAMEQETFARKFTAAMDCRGVYLAPAMAGKVDLKAHRHVLDIAGGSGVYACALVARHAHLRATILERPPVDQISSKSIAARGFADRVFVRAGNMFSDPFPSECDVHLYSNVLHDWDEPIVRELLQKSFATLHPGGMLLIHDAHINPTKTGPLPVAAYSALLMNITEGKCYSEREMEDFLTQAGFEDVRYLPTVADRSVITARKVKKVGRQT